MDKSGFPLWYGILIREMVSLPQPAVEEIRMTYTENGEYITEKVKINMIIRNGFMMGNPVTKVVLHGFHLAEEGVVKQLLENFGYRPDSDTNGTIPKKYFIPKEIG